MLISLCIMDRLRKRSFKFNKAVVMIIIIALINIGGIFIFLNISRWSNIKFMTKNMLIRLEKNFEEYEANMTKTLESSLDILVRNETMAKIFLSGNRDELFNYSADLFDHIKKNKYFTHWYFLNTEDEGTCFLRMHNRRLYGDRISRFTYQKSVETKKMYSGKELGKTAFALRSVHPWYYKGELIGYIELGIEIESFFRNLKKTFEADLGLIVNKSSIDKTKWASVRKEKGLRLNWDDHPNYLLINKTTDNKELIDLQEISESIPSEKKILSIKKTNGKHFMRGIIPLSDASGNKVGLIYFLKDITNVFSKLSNQALILMIIIFFFLLILTFLMIYFHKKAEGQLRKYRENLEEIIEERTKELKSEFIARLEAEGKQLRAVKLAEKSSKMASLGVMAAGIAHEINQPLNAIKISSDSALFKSKNDGNELDETYISKLKSISEGVDRISVIINNMRNFWILPDDTNIDIIDLNEAAEAAINLLRPRMDKNKIELIFDRPDKPVQIKAVLVHLEQIVLNLLSNSIKSLISSEAGGKIIKIKVGFENNMTILSVEDNGPGLNDLTIEELADPFFSTGKNGEGTGLGLAIVTHYMKKYKGNIRAYNNENGGASFILEFPMADKLK